MNATQEAALAKLDKALKACSNAKIYLYVANGSLLAYDAELCEQFQADGRGDLHAAQTHFMEENEYFHVQSYGTRIDGGDF